MRNLKLSTGGHDLRMDDLKFIQDGFKEIVAELLSSEILEYSSPLAIRGVVVTNPTLNASVTVGSIFYNGEVYLVDAQSATGAGTLYWVIEVTTPLPQVTFEDGNPRDVYEFRKLKPTYINPGANGFPHSLLKRYTRTDERVGEIITIAKTITEDKYLLCDGAEYNNSAYPDLYAAIGQKFTKKYKIWAVFGEYISAGGISYMKLGMSSTDIINFGTNKTAFIGMFITQALKNNILYYYDGSSYTSIGQLNEFDTLEFDNSGTSAIGSTGTEAIRQITYKVSPFVSWPLYILWSTDHTGETVQACYCADNASPMFSVPDPVIHMSDGGLSFSGFKKYIQAKKTVV